MTGSALEYSETGIDRRSVDGQVRLNLMESVEETPPSTQSTSFSSFSVPRNRRHNVRHIRCNRAKRIALTRILAATIRPHPRMIRRLEKVTQPSEIALTMESPLLVILEGRSKVIQSEKEQRTPASRAVRSLEKP